MGIGAHQGHRIIESKMKKMVGNVHAVAVTCCHVGNQSKLQNALAELLRTLDYNIGYPQPEWLSHNMAVLRRTLLRRHLFVSGTVQDELVIDLPPAIEKFYNAFNGDWRKPRVSFWTAGRNISKEEAKLLLFGAALEVDLLQSKESELPSLDDWYTVSEAASKSTLGIMAHCILPQVYDLALPTWGAMLPNDRSQGSVDGATAFRIRLQRKAWRAKKFLEDKSLKEDCALLTYLGVSVEQLMKRLDVLDQAGKGSHVGQKHGSFNYVLRTRTQTMMVVCEVSYGLRPVPQPPL